MTDTGIGTVREFPLPDLGEGLEDAEILEWHVSAGQRVELNQPLLSVETAKATVEVPSPFAGTVLETCAADGDTVAVGAVLLRIAEFGAGNGTGSGPAEDGEPKLLVGYGASEERRTRPGRPGRRLAKPPARRLAKELGVDLAGLPPGTGPQGSITRRDVELAAARPPEPVPGAEKFVPGFGGRRPGDVEQVRGIRKRIIARLEQSRRDIPHATCRRDADLTELWRLREVLTAQAAAEGVPVKITPTTMICRAALTALRRFPALNARYDPQAQEIRLLEPINLGLAVDTGRGLMVPNIKDAHLLTTHQLAGRAAELAKACRDGTATPAELTGGTFTVDNYGWFGTDDGDPIINPPEAAILGIGTIRERPWVVAGAVLPRRVCTFTLAFDHRVCDGGEAGRFVTYLTELCAEPARILLHG